MTATQIYEWIIYATLALAVVSIIYNVVWIIRHERKTQHIPTCADTGAPKDPGNCWNVRCQLGKKCCRAKGAK
jgi:hypothetical protein